MPVSTIACTPSDHASGSISSVAIKGSPPTVDRSQSRTAFSTRSRSVSASHHDVEILHTPVARIVGDRLQVAEQHFSPCNWPFRCAGHGERTEQLSTVPRMSPLSTSCSPTRNASSSRKEHRRECLVPGSGRGPPRCRPRRRRPAAGRSAAPSPPARSSDAIASTMAPRPSCTNTGSSVPQPRLAAQFLVMQRIDRRLITRQTFIDQHTHHLPEQISDHQDHLYLKSTRE